MAEKQFPIAAAVAALRKEGLLDGVYLPGENGLELLAADDPAVTGAAGAFLGAGLDNRGLAADELFVALRGEKTDGRSYAPAALASGHWVLTRPVAGDDVLAGQPAATGVLLSGDPGTALGILGATWRREFDLPVAGITGTNGKTTTKDFLAALLAGAGPVHATRGNFNNRLGLPLTLLGLRGEHRFAVVEMGASAVGQIAELAAWAGPTLAVITNADRAHLAEFGSLDGVIQGKGEILENLPPDGRAVLNADSPGFADWVDRAPCPVVSFGRGEGDYLWSWLPAGQDEGPRLVLGGEIWPVPLPGAHNAANLAAAVLAARALGLSAEQMRRGLAGFRGSAHRSFVLEVGGRIILDDAYNANPASMLAAAGAVARLPETGRALAVLGHMAELGPDSEDLHRQTGRQLAAGRLDVLIAVGAEAALLAEGFAEAGGRAVSCADLAEAAGWLAEYTGPGDRILIKGSRSAGMEELIPLLEDAWEEKEEKP